MKKICIILFLLSLCVLTLAACDSSLSQPTGLIFDVETQTLTWSAVKGAKFYTVQISGQEREITTKTTSVSLEDLAAGDYEIRIRANSDGKAFDDSGWTVYQFTREEESGLKYELINNDTAYQLVGGGTASGDVVMEDTFRGKPVVAIADKALYSNTKITGFTVGKNVKTIGQKAFAKCTLLTSVVIPEGVTSVGEYAFQSCKSLSSIVIPDSVTEITPHMFTWCSALTNVTIGQYVTVISDYAFANCESLVSITYTGSDSAYRVSLPDTVQIVRSYAFADCYALPEMDLGSNVELIAPYAFTNCRSLARVELGEKLLGMGSYAFAYCAALEAVSLPDTAVFLDDNVFRSCSLLNTVSLGSGMKTVGADVFRDTAILNNAQKMLVIDGWLIKYLDETAQKITISSDIYGIASRAVAQCNQVSQVELRGVQYIGIAAFYGCESLYKVTIDDALLELGDYAFCKCPYLYNVVLGNGLQSIGSYAFAGCEKLNNMAIPDSVTVIGTRAFRDSGAFKNTKIGVVYMDEWAVDYVSDGGMGAIVINEGIKGIANYTFSEVQAVFARMADSVEYIGRGAFYNCGKIFSIMLPKNLKVIGDYAFYGCMSANFGAAKYDLIIPEGTESIGRSAFYQCECILSVSIPGSVKTIGDYAFYGCVGIGDTAELNLDTGKTDENGNPIFEIVPVTGQLLLNSGIETIGLRAFQGCMKLGEVIVPNTVTSLGDRVFYDCQGLKKVVLGSGITQIGSYTFYNCFALETVAVSGQLRSIGDYAFRGCAALTKFDLRDVQHIGRYAFYGCSGLTELAMTDSLISIGDYAFRGCTGVKAFTVPMSVTAIGKHVFYGLNGASLYCQAESVPAGWNAQYNSSFRPVFFGCALSEDGTYVVSVTVRAATLRNMLATNGISDPVRDGYQFAGWAVDPGSSVAGYTTETLAEVTDGTILYAIWMPVG